MFEKVNFTHSYWIFLLPLVFMAIDVLTGYLYAWQTHDIQSSKMRSGIVKKGGEMICIMACYVLSVALTLPIDITKFFSILIVFTEVNSNIENLSLLGVPMPGWVRRRINGAVEELEGDQAPDEDPPQLPAGMEDDGK